MRDSLAELRTKVAQSCRILAMEGLVEEVTGHVSARVPGSPEMLLRCRSRRNERGVAFTTPDDVRRVSLDGHDRELGDAYAIPQEHALHGELYQARPEINAVVHAHPPSVLLCSLAGVKWVPLYGAYDPTGTMLAANEVPVYASSILLRTAEELRPVVALMGNHPICVLKGHGALVVGRTVEEATLRAVKFERLSWVHWQLMLAGKTPAAIPSAELASFRELFAGRDARPAGVANSSDEWQSWLWNHYLQLLERHEQGQPARTQVGTV